MGRRRGAQRGPVSRVLLSQVSSQVYVRTHVELASAKHHCHLMADHLQPAQQRCLHS